MKIDNSRLLGKTFIYNGEKAKIIAFSTEEEETNYTFIIELKSIKCGEDTIDTMYIEPLTVLKTYEKCKNWTWIHNDDLMDALLNYKIN